MHQRGGGDVQLGAAHHDAVVVAADDPQVEVRVVLLVGPAAAVALRVGDHLGRAQVVVTHVAVHALDVGGVLRVHLGDRVLDAHQRHEDAGDAADDRHLVHQFDALLQVRLAARDLEDAVGALAVLAHEAHHLAAGWVAIVVVARGDRQRGAELRVRGDVVDALAVPVEHAAITQGLDVFLGGLQAHGFLRWASPFLERVTVPGA